MAERKRSMKIVFGLIVMIVIAPTAVLHGKTIYVDANSPGNNDGSSWGNAYVFLKDAMVNATSLPKPLEIRVAQGIYRPDRSSANPEGTGIRTNTFQLVNNTVIKGGYAGFGKAHPDERSIDVYETILTGDLAGNDGPDFADYDENSYHVTSGKGTNSTAALDGFTIIGGNANNDYPNNGGAGMSADYGSPTVSNCTFTKNRAVGGGSAFACYAVDVKLEGCAFIENQGENSALWSSECKLTLTNCVFAHNSTGWGGALQILLDRGSEITNCLFLGNSGTSGGAVFSHGSTPTITNCIFSGNHARDGGALYNTDGEVTIINCTIVGNASTQQGSVVSCVRHGVLYVHNSILCNNESSSSIWPVYLFNHSSASINYSNVRGGGVWKKHVHWGPGNISVDPMFTDADGVDGVIGTEDDDLRLCRGSACIDAGDSSAIPASIASDIDGRPRIAGAGVDMGAYEGGVPYPPVMHYVDTLNGDDRNHGRTVNSAFATIQKGIDTVEDGDIVLVLPGVYTEEINFMGKAISVQGLVGAAGAPILQNPGDFAASFYLGEGPNSILQNFIIRNSFMGVFIAASSPTISNVTVVDNTYAMEAYAGSDPAISNSIFWNNEDSGLFGCKAYYSCAEHQADGLNNIHENPCFADAANGDYHLRSRRGRHWPSHDVWVLDEITSPCIDAGDPLSHASEEPTPNGSRINMGAYGGTAYASLSETDPDINHDGVVDMFDFAILADNWLQGNDPSGGN